MKKYPKVRSVGHREIQALFDGPVLIQEKIDGSNFGFGKTNDGKLIAVSRTQDLDFDRPEKMFAPALEYVKGISERIPLGRFFRCEYLSQPKHNVLEYSRIPTNHLVLFDIDLQADTTWFQSTNRARLLDLANELDIEPVQELWCGPAKLDEVRDAFNLKWSKQESQLGGPAMEGVVIKNYDRFTPDGSVLLGKWVRDEFKEQHRHVSLADKSDPVEVIGASYGGPARWQKALQRLEETGRSTNSPEDIGMLIGIARKDVEEECEDAIKEALWKHYRKNVVGAATKGLAEWYKGKLGL
jgi:hypothetical protein